MMDLEQVEAAIYRATHMVVWAAQVEPKKIDLIVLARKATEPA